MSRLVIWWDHFVYRLAFRSLTRMLKRNPGLAYLFELNLKRYREANPISEETKKQTHLFSYLIDELQQRKAWNNDNV